MTLNHCVFNVNFLRNMSLNVVNDIRKDVYFLQFSVYMEVDHDDASSTSLQTISSESQESKIFNLSSVDTGNLN